MFFVVSCLLTVVLIIGIIYLLRKLHKDRQEINELSGAGVNFQNGGAMRNNAGISSVPATSSSSNCSAAIISTTSSKYQPYHNEEEPPSSITFDNGKMTNNLIDAF